MVAGVTSVSFRALLLLVSVALCLAVPSVAQQAQAGRGGIVRILDKITGNVTDLELANGESRQVGLLTISLGECRYPANNPSGDAYEMLTILYRGGPDPVFRGWMIASEPSLNALEHPRYDVWPLRCITS